MSMGAAASEEERGVAELQRISPCLWFDGTAERAARRYVDLFPDSEVLRVVRAPRADPRHPPSTVFFRLCGVELMALNGGPQYELTPAASLVARCEDQLEIDRVWSALIEGGQPLQAGWLTDRFGLSWQILPRRLDDLLKDGDPARAARAAAALSEMAKIDLAALEAAAA